MRKIRTIRLIVALGLGLLVGLPQTSIAQESSEFTELRLEVRTEAINRMVDAIASRLERIDPAKAERVRTTRPSESFVKGHLDAGVDATLDALFKGDLSSGRLTKTDLKFDMELFRSVDRAYTVKPFKASDMPPLSGFEPPRATGYPAEVAAIDNAAPHSMHDMPDYLADRFTRAALDRAVRNGYTVEIHVGGETDALSDLRNRGYTVTGEVKSGNGNYERLLVAEKAGEVRYVVSGTVDGMDRVRHLAALLRFAGPEGKGIAPDKLVVVGDADALREANTRTMAEGLSRMGLPSETAIIGFRGTLRNELLERALARRGAEHVSDLLGSDPATALEDQVRAERDAASGERRAKLDALLGEVTGNKKLAGLKAANNPERVFSNIGDLKDLVGAERELARLAKKHSSAVLDGLVADGKLRLPGGASAKDFTISRPLEFGALRAEEIRVRRANGTVEGVRLINNYYGDAMSSVVRALLETGHTKLAYFGTAGGVAPGVKVGDIHIPDKVYDFRGELASEGVRNAFLDKLDPNTSSLGKRLHLNTELGNVFSPAEETMSWLENTRAKGIHSIEVENSYITREVQRYNAAAESGKKATLATSVIISDVPGSEATLGNSNGATTATFEKMVDHYLETLGIKDLELVAKDEARPADKPLAQTEKSRLLLEVSERLIPRAAAKSAALRDRIAETLAELSVDQLKAISDAAKLKPSAVKGLSEEARARLDAEVKGAYTDAAMIKSAERANGVLSLVAAEVAKAHPGAEVEFRLAGGIERGAFSPAAGLDVEVMGSDAVRETARAALESARGKVKGAPEIRLTQVGGEAVSLSGKTLKAEVQPLVREVVSRALVYRGVYHRGASSVYVGTEHDPSAKPSELFSRYEAYETGPRAESTMVRDFERRIGRLGGRVEYVSSLDPRLRGGQGRTVISPDGRPLVLLPKDRAIRKFALIDELTHARQIDQMRRHMGSAKVRELFTAAEGGDPAATARMLEWEIKAKRNIRMTLPEGDPNRALLGREIDRLQKVLDPYVEARLPNGRLDWSKVRAMAKNHAEGGASFLLGLFLKDLARVIQTGDRAVIEAFFDGLATTEFWTQYGMFVVGAEVGSAAYSRYLARFVKPTFVSNVLKSNIALATGMALPELIRGKFEGKTFAVNFAGLMLSSAAVQAGLAAIKWVAPIGRLSRFRSMARVLKVARGVPGWVYAGVETAVVLYFGEEISAGINRWLERREMRRDVARSAEDLLKAAREASGPDDPALTEALEASGVAYIRWRDRSMRPAMDATLKFRASMESVAREATTTGTGQERFDSVSDRYAALRASRDRLAARRDAELDAKVEEALAQFERDRANGLREAYEENRRGTPYDPIRDADEVSENRPEAYADEAALYEAAARRATDPEVQALLQRWADTTRQIAAQERAVLFPGAEPAPPPPSPGLSGALEEAVR